MLGGIGFNSAYSMNQYSRDIENVAKYALGSALVIHEPSPFDGMGMMLGIGVGIEGLKGIGWLNKAYKNQLPDGFFNGLTKEEIAYANKKMINPLSNGGWKTSEGYKTAGQNIKNAWGKFSAEATTKAEAFNKAGGLGSWEAYKDAIIEGKIKTIDAMIPQGEKFEKLSEQTRNLYKEVQTLTKQAAEAPEGAKEILKAAKEKLAQAGAMAHGELVKIPATTNWGKFTKGLGKYTGLSKLNGWAKDLATKSPLAEKLLRHGKGNAWFFALEGGMALFTQIIPSFTQLGAASGIKQVLKSTAKVGASVGGWVLGSAAAAPAAAMAGAAIGSIVPGIGTAIGAVVGGLIGMVGGLIGSWAATKVVDHVVGKDELELAKEKEAEKLAQQAAKSPEQMQAMLATAAQRLEAEGKDTEDAKVVFGSLENLAKIAQKTQATANPTAVQDNTAFTGINNPFSPEQIQAMYNEQNSSDEDFMAMSSGLTYNPPKI